MQMANGMERRGEREMEIRARVYMFMRIVHSLMMFASPPHKCFCRVPCCVSRTRRQGVAKK